MQKSSPIFRARNRIGPHFGFREKWRPCSDPPLPNPFDLDLLTFSQRPREGQLLGRWLVRPLRPLLFLLVDPLRQPVPVRQGWFWDLAADGRREYADTSQDERDLQAKIHTLLGAGTRYVWVVRLTGPRRVEVHTPDGSHMAYPGEELKAPGILRNPVRVEALYDPAAAHEAALRNLLQRHGYRDLDAVLKKGREEGELAIVLRQLHRMVGPFPEANSQRIGQLDHLIVYRTQTNSSVLQHPLRVPSQADWTRPSFSLAEFTRGLFGEDHEKFETDRNDDGIALYGFVIGCFCCRQRAKAFREFEQR